MGSEAQGNPARTALNASAESIMPKHPPRQFTPGESITLTTIGSRGVQVEVEPAALREAYGGMTVWIELEDGPLAVTFTKQETYALICQALRALVDDRWTRDG